MTDLSARVTAEPMFERIVQELRSLAGEEAGAAEPATSEDGASPPEQGKVVTPDRRLVLPAQRRRRLRDERGRRSATLAAGLMTQICQGRGGDIRCLPTRWGTDEHLGRALTGKASSYST
jgi:hypothetical protein